MLYKIDHIAYGSDNFERDSLLLKQAGYTNFFCESQLQNMQSTKEIMYSPSDLFDISLFTRDHSLSVELLNYGQIHDCAGTFRFAPSTSTQDGVLSRFLYSSTQQEHRLQLRSKDIETSLAFWKLFRFTPIAEGSSSYTLQFRSFFKDPSVTLELVSSKQKRTNCYIDCRGFTVLAFIADDAQKEHQRMLDHSLCPTCISPLFINGQYLSIFFVRSPCGAIAEILSIDNI